jgi:hypothetical protein
MQRGSFAKMQIDPRDACMPPVGAYRKAAAPTTRLRRLDSRTIQTASARRFHLIR